MSCPYFLPDNPVPISTLPHPERLPLGNAYSGRCTAADLSPSEAMLHDCNLGYAKCAHLPADRIADAVRFSIKRDARGLVTISYVLELAHAPVSHGIVIHDRETGRWPEPHPDARIQRMAECCAQSLSKDR